MNMERAARIHQYGAPEVLAVEPVEVTAPEPGEVRIRRIQSLLRCRPQRKR
jgi:NADPH:quinone reductase-like Zn-dependent oxidoreductase